MTRQDIIDHLETLGANGFAQIWPNLFPEGDSFVRIEYPLAWTPILVRAMSEVHADLVAESRCEQIEAIAIDFGELEFFGLDRPSPAFRRLKWIGSATMGACLICGAHSTERAMETLSHPWQALLCDRHVDVIGPGGFPRVSAHRRLHLAAGLPSEGDWRDLIRIDGNPAERIDVKWRGYDFLLTLRAEAGNTYVVAQLLGRCDKEPLALGVRAIVGLERTLTSRAASLLNLR